MRIFITILLNCLYDRCSHTLRICIFIIHINSIFPNNLIIAPICPKTVNRLYMKVFKEDTSKIYVIVYDNNTYKVFLNKCNK